MNLFDVVVGFIVIWGSYKGFKNGLIKSLGGILGWIASIIVALSFNRPLADYLDKRFDIVATFGEVIPLPNFSFEAENISKAIVNAGVQEMALPDFLKKSLIENIDQLLIGGNYFDVSLSELIAYGLAGMLLKGVSFLILFSATGILIKIGVDLLSGVFAVTPLGPINKLSGAALGFVMNVVIVTVIIGLLSPVVILSAAQNGTIAAIIHSSYSFPYLLELFLSIGNYIFGLINVAYL
ncbi:CvpA family protein [Desulfitibacter alkalitolerans]|uniref:CvpA family protein n=1 Tax=Desulfitibacter alkalitolerans TaxID=264641 RepID=UPI00048037F7|nr:CvpA family protein [Desulfitibacter alkalitolerans]